MAVLKLHMGMSKVAWKAQMAAIRGEAKLGLVIDTEGRILVKILSVPGLEFPEPTFLPKRHWPKDWRFLPNVTGQIRDSGIHIFSERFTA